MDELVENCFTKCQDDANIADMEITRENKYFVLYKKTNGMFPAVEETPTA